VLANSLLTATRTRSDDTALCGPPPGGVAATRTLVDGVAITRIEQVIGGRARRTQPADPVLDRDHWGSGYAPGSVRLAPADVGYLWGIRAEVVVGQAFSLVTGVQPRDCRSIAKASKVRILHLPPRAREGP
jgi:hypothetical protein